MGAPRVGIVVTIRDLALPLIPDGDEARRWAEQELSDPVYQAAEPTPFDRMARAIGEFLGSLFSGSAPAALAPWMAVGVVLILLAIVVLAVIVWGRPRRTARSRANVDLFGFDDARRADELRAASRAAADREDWEEAIALRFRALSRGLVERTVLDPAPGTTVHGFARQASAAFPDEDGALAHAADLFDDVRYLRRPGDASGYRSVAELDKRLSQASPRFETGIREDRVGAVR